MSSLSGHAAALLFLVAPNLATAQTVAGTVVDSATGKAIQEFTVQLVDDHGTTISAALAKDRGRYLLRAPAAGAFRVRVLRIGYRRVESPRFALNPGETREQRIAMLQVPTSLSSIRVVERQQCEIPQEEGAAFAVVWEEVRKAVQAVELTGNMDLLRVTVRDYSRELPVRGGRSTHDTSSERSGTSSSPYFSPPPDTLARYGYVRPQSGALVYYAPDARVLLSDTFARSHCFRLQGGKARDVALIGLAFDAINPRPTDIRGVLWVDRATSELRSLEYSYTSLPGEANGGDFGGSVGFQHIPGGAWIIRDWKVRAPVIRVQARGDAFSGMASRTGGSDTLLAGIHEQGGEVLLAATESGVVLWTGADSALPGTITNSTTPAPPDPALPASVHATTDADHPAAQRLARCEEIRRSRESEITAAVAVPANQWHPSGADSVATTEAVRGAPTILQAIGDTLGNVDLGTMRALRHGPDLTYKPAVDALVQLHPGVEEPVAGCKVRRLILLPFRVQAAP